VARLLLDANGRGCAPPRPFVKLIFAVIGLRRHLRLFAALWLLSQATTLGAFARQQCCVEPRPTAAQQPGCHEPAPPPCPMQHAAGRPCPMHRHSATDPDRGDTACKLRGSCSVPVDALAVVLSQHAVLIEPLALASIEPSGGIVAEPAQNTAARRPPPDSPPPRA